MFGDSIHKVYPTGADSLEPFVTSVRETKNYRINDEKFLDHQNCITVRSSPKIVKCIWLNITGPSKDNEITVGHGAYLTLDEAEEVALALLVRVKELRDET